MSSFQVDFHSIFFKMVRLKPLSNQDHEVYLTLAHILMIDGSHYCDSLINDHKSVVCMPVWHGHRNMMDLPIENGGFFHSHFCMFTRPGNIWYLPMRSMKLNYVGYILYRNFWQNLSTFVKTMEHMVTIQSRSKVDMQGHNPGQPRNDAKTHWLSPGKWYLFPQIWVIQAFTFPWFEYIEFIPNHHTGDFIQTTLFGDPWYTRIA